MLYIYLVYLTSNQKCQHKNSDCIAHLCFSFFSSVFPCLCLDALDIFLFSVALQQNLKSKNQTLVYFSCWFEVSVEKLCIQTNNDLCSCVVAEKREIRSSFTVVIVKSGNLVCSPETISWWIKEWLSNLSEHSKHSLFPVCQMWRFATFPIL